MTVDDNYQGSVSSVALATPNLCPERCGITDYSIRMAALLGNLGIETTVLASAGQNIGKAIVTSEGTVTTDFLNQPPFPLKWSPYRCQ